MATVAEPRRPIVGIHQPNFFPWLGYFAKLVASDIFVILDDAPLPGGAGSWVNRVRLKIGGLPQWITAPLSRPHGTCDIRDVRFCERKMWRTKLLKTLHASYARSDFFAATMAVLEPLLADDDPSLARFNTKAIGVIATAIGIASEKLVLSSTLPSSGAGTERLVSLVQAVNGATYLSGDGAATYQCDALFAEAGLGLSRLGFHASTYPQLGKGDFVPGLSIIDALMNIGTAGVAEHLARYASCKRKA